MDESVNDNVNVENKGDFEPTLKSFTVTREEMLKDWKEGNDKYQPTLINPEATGKVETVTVKKVDGTNMEIKLRPGQTFYEFKNDPEAEKKIIEEMRKSGTNDPACVCNPNVHDKCIDRGNPLMHDLDKLWVKMGEVFTEYKTADTDRILDEMKKKLPGITMYWNKNGANDRLCVIGATTNISKADVRKAFDGLKGITTESNANKIIATILTKKIKKLFG
jgi:hypothetical protein